MSISKPESGSAGQGPAHRTASGFEPGETTSLPSEGTEVLSDSPDDVLVLLPEGAEGEVPVVETEAVEDTNTEVVTASPSLEDVPLKNVNPLLTDMMSEAPAEEAPGSFEDLAAEADEDLFGTEPVPDLKPVRRPRRDSGADRPRPLPEFFPHSPESRGSRGRWKIPVALAAALLLCVGGYLSFPHWKHVIEGQLTAISPPKPAGKTAPATPAKGAKGGSHAATPDLVRASKEAFREKFLLTIELGYVGEVANE